MLQSLIHVQPLKLRLFTASDNIHVVAAAQAMVEDAEEAVGIRWIVHANHFTSPSQRIVDISGGLMTETIVVIAPCMTCEQNIERRERPPPRESFALFQPFGMLGGHRIDHLGERLVRGPHSMTARKQVAFKPSLTEMLAQHFHHATIRTQFVIDRDNLRHRTAFGGFEDGVQAIGV